MKKGARTNGDEGPRGKRCDFRDYPFVGNLSLCTKGEGRKGGGKGERGIAQETLRGTKCIYSFHLNAGASSEVNHSPF